MFELKQIYKDDWHNLDKHNQSKYFGNLLKLASVSLDTLHNQFEFYEYLIVQSLRLKLKFHLVLESLNNLGVLFFRNGQHLMAKKFFKCGVKHLIQLDSQSLTPLQFIALINMANLYYCEKNFQKGQIYAEQALIKLEPYYQKVFTQLRDYITIDGIYNICKEFRTLQSKQLEVSNQKTKQDNYFQENFTQMAQNLVENILANNIIQPKRAKSILQGRHDKMYQLIKLGQIGILRDIEDVDYLYQFQRAITPDYRIRNKDRNRQNQTESSDTKEYYFSENNTNRNQKPFFKISRNNPNSMTLSSEQHSNISQLMAKDVGVKRVQSAKPYQVKRQDSETTEQFMSKMIEELMNQKLKTFEPPDKTNEIESQLQSLQKQVEESNILTSHKDNQIEELKELFRVLNQDFLKMSVQFADNQNIQDKFQRENSIQQSLQMTQIQKQQIIIQQQMEMQQQLKLQITELSEQMAQKKQLESLVQNIKQYPNLSSIPIVQSQESSAVLHKKTTSELLAGDLIATMNQSSHTKNDRQESLMDSQFLQHNDELLQMNFLDPKGNTQCLINLILNLTFAQSVTHNKIKYHVSCTMMQVKPKMNKQGDCFLQIKVTYNNMERQENIDISTLKTLLQYTEYQSVLPSTIPLKCISDYKTFIQYMVMPFIAVVLAPPNDFKIEVWPKSPGLLGEEDMKFKFGEFTVPISLYHLQGSSFRVLLYNKAEVQPILRFDFVLDDGSFDALFEQQNIDEYAHAESQSIARLLEVYDDFNFNDQSRLEIKKIVESRKIGLQSVFHLPTLSIKDLGKLTIYLQQIITEWEIVLKKQGIQKQHLEEYFRDNSKNCLVKTWNLTSNSRLGLMTTQKSSLDIQLLNVFETYAPNAQKIKAQGSIVLPYTDLMRRFGCDHAKMSQSDLKLFCSYLLQMYTLDVFEKPLDDEDYNRMKDNCISETPIDYAGCYRHYIVNGYLNPFTMTYLGVNDKPIGLRAQGYDPSMIKEAGIFIVMNPECWLKPEIPVKDNKNKKRVKRFTKEYAVTNKYWIPFILKCVGWKMIIDQINIYNDLTVDISLKSRQQSVVERFETLITFKSVLEYLER